MIGWLYIEYCGGNVEAIIVLVYISMQYLGLSSSSIGILLNQRLEGMTAGVEHLSFFPQWLCTGTLSKPGNQGNQWCLLCFFLAGRWMVQPGQVLCGLVANQRAQRRTELGASHQGGGGDSWHSRPGLRSRWLDTKTCTNCRCYCIPFWAISQNWGGAGATGNWHSPLGESVAPGWSRGNVQNNFMVTRASSSGCQLNWSNPQCSFWVGSIKSNSKLVKIPKSTFSGGFTWLNYVKIC